MKRLLPGAVSVLFLLGGMNCSTPLTQTYSDAEMATAWADMTTFITQYTPANSPTYASRCIGYLGLTMYESVVHGYDEYQSLAGQLNGLDVLPLPEQGETYNWRVAFNAGQAYMLKHIYNQTSEENKARIDSLELIILQSLKSETKDAKTVERSIAYGQSIATSLFEWSKTDGGHRGYLNNFDKEWVHPIHPGSWKPPLYAQSFSHHPLHPHWGSNRTFLSENSNLPLPEFIPYDTTKTSAYYQEFLQVYEKDLELTQKEKEIAIWWGDDPDDTFTPPGHSYYLSTIAIRKENPSLIVCAETYAKVGVSVADAFINCWKWKYHFFTERPNTFIPQFIDEEWESFWPDPPFPAFPSGHAIQAAASATALEEMFGTPFVFIDSAHVGRERDQVRDVDFVERPFETFWGVAEETADSRFFGGIHTPQDNRVGLEEGKKIAERVCKLKWRKKPRAVSYQRQGEVRRERTEIREGG